MFPPEGPKPIEGYHAWLDEYQACKYWDRPARKYHTDIPFYPWAPPEPKPVHVTFRLGFK